VGSAEDVRVLFPHSFHHPMHSISIKREELGELGPVVLDPVAVNFLLPYQHQSHPESLYGQTQRDLVLVSHDLLVYFFLLKLKRSSCFQILGDGFQITEWRTPEERSYICTKART
jgi:hypothetical protein